MKTAAANFNISTSVFIIVLIIAKCRLATPICFNRYLLKNAENVQTLMITSILTAQ